MKSIVAVNTNIPSADQHFDFFSGASLRDHDIVVFDPALPYGDRIQFTGGGSCLTVEATAVIIKAISHWANELRSALKAGKTVFVLLNEYREDQGATGSTYDRKQRTYSVRNFSNYQTISVKIQVQNARGEKMVLANANYRALYEVLKDFAHSGRARFDEAMASPENRAADRGLMSFAASARRK
ncbi:hypothetical protein [Sphingopyxis panaciterrae]